MSEISERAESRLENLKTIEPLIASLRTLSLSTMQMAINRKNLLHTYQNEYYRILANLLSMLSKKELSSLIFDTPVSDLKILVVLGSERGICGPYNRNLAALGADWQSRQSHMQRILSFGKRVKPSLTQAGVKFEHQGTLSAGSLPQYHKAHAMVNAWLQAYNQGNLFAVEVLSFRKIPLGGYKPSINTLLPITEDMESHANLASAWPPPIIEGDPLPILKRAIEHLTAIKFYELILDSIAAENAIRYSMLEEAKDNVQDLIETLSVAMQIEKRQTITQQIQELSVGAGLTN